MSSGPATENGKAVARWNSTQHGISSPEPVIPGVESREDWEEHCCGILDNLSPVGHLEITLAERIAVLSWRLHRVTRYESESIALSQEKIEGDLAEKRRFRSGIRGPSHPEDVLERPKDTRKTERLLKKLSEYPDEKKLPGPDADAILWSVAQRIEEEADLEELELPGVPEWAGIYGDTSEWDGWTVGLVRTCLRLIASAAEEDLDELLDAARESARLDTISAKHEAQEVKQEMENMSRERLLPDVRTLEKITRYEAHLSRQMFKALHELEALQKYRTGGEAPLARLDVDGLPEGALPGE